MNRNYLISSAEQEAAKQYRSFDSTFNSMKATFNERLNGNTGSVTTGAFIGFCGIAILYIAALVGIFMITPLWVSIPTIVAVMGLLTVRFLDLIMQNNYYKIIRDRVATVDTMRSGLSNRSASNSSFTSMCESARAHGWDYNLTAGTSIVTRSAEINREMSNMNEIVTTGINRWKDVLFYIAIIIFGIAGCMAMYAVVGNLILQWTNDGVSITLLRVLMGILTVIAIGAGVYCGSLVRTITDSEVKNLTLLIPLAVPVAFGLVSLVLTGIVYLVILIVRLVLYLLGVALLLLIVIGMCGGG